MNIGKTRREYIIEPLEEPRWIEEPASTPVEQPAEPQRKEEPVPA